jgi:hypothetical protein
MTGLYPGSAGVRVIIDSRQFLKFELPFGFGGSLTAVENRRDKAIMKALFTASVSRISFLMFGRLRERSFR